jgi:hypothetical protein
MTTTADLAADLGVDESDTAQLFDRLAEDDPDLNSDAVPDDAASFSRQLLYPHGERTAPAGCTGPAQTHSHAACTDWADQTRQPPRAVSCCS